MLRIRNFNARYFLQRDASDEWHTQRRLDRIVTTLLPQAVGDYWGRTTGSSDAVYRIRELHISLWLDELERGDGMIATVWARLLAQAIAHALRNGTPANVVRYDDHSHFLAAFLVDLLAGQAWSRWMYDEFKPLQDLPTGRVAALLLAPRPELLLPIARRLQARQSWERLVRSMEASDVALIWERGLGFTNLPPSVAPETLPSIPTGVLLEQGQETAFARNRLRLFVALRNQTPPPSPAVAATISHHLALLHWLSQHRPSEWLWQALASGEIKSIAAIAPLLTRLGTASAPLQAWLAQLLPIADGRRYLAQLVRALQPAVATDSPDARPQQISTAFAGLALLLPALRDLELYETLGPPGMYQLLLDAVGPGLRPLALGDPAIAWMAGVEPDHTEAAQQADVAWPEVDPATVDMAAGSGCRPATWLVLRHFAAGLRGFARSSPAYLAEQFFNQPGYAVITDEAVEFYLSRSPLGIVLQMAGKTGEQGAIPWRNGRALTIHLP